MEWLKSKARSLALTGTIRGSKQVLESNLALE
jgi:hypothetical protein